MLEINGNFGIQKRKVPQKCNAGGGWRGLHRLHRGDKGTQLGLWNLSQKKAQWLRNCSDPQNDIIRARMMVYEPVYELLQPVHNTKTFTDRIG